VEFLKFAKKCQNPEVFMILTLFSDLKNSTCMYLCRHMRSAAAFATEELKQICTATDEKKT
jgi:hypothetical protein